MAKRVATTVDNCQLHVADSGIASKRASNDIDEDRSSIIRSGRLRRKRLSNVVNAELAIGMAQSWRSGDAWQTSKE